MTDGLLHGRMTRLRVALRCPTCRGTLEDREADLRCVACGTAYPVVGGRPVLMTVACRQAMNVNLETDDGRRMVEDYEASPAPRGAVRSLFGLLRPPPIMYRYHPDLRKPPTSILFDPPGESGRLVLNVGGGPYRVSDGEITLNIGLFPGVDLVADAHDIPLADDSVDAVFSLAVLEHVADPQRVVREMIRVLKPGGVLYSEVPFLFFFHGYPSDYTRFTREGMKRLFAALTDCRVGITHGPMSAVLQSANMTFGLLLPERPRVLRRIFNGAFRWLVFPLKYLDLALRDHPDAHIAAGGFYVLGRKPAVG